ncbi:MAG: CoA transferase [Dehalococcoidia bacterium]|nr:MAG: CoA transferase [Dehalococcoidia bacterium]
MIHSNKNREMQQRSDMVEGALSHLKVLELCSMVAGPYCTKVLADLGAEVIKIEQPGRGDSVRWRGPFLQDQPDPELSGVYLYLNTNKLGITLDVTTGTGQRILKELIAQANILVEDYSPAFIKGMGLDYEVLKGVNPRLVMTSITPFGQIGPYRDYRAYELNVFHAGGEGYMLPIQSRYPDREPVKGGGLAADCICGLSASLATLAAIYRMNMTGFGQHVDVSQQDVLMTLVGLEVAHYTYSGLVRSRHYRPLPLATPSKSKDGYIMITASVDRDWQTFARLTGNTSWAEDERYQQRHERWQYSEEINERVAEWVLQQNGNKLFHLLQENAVSSAPVNTAEDLLSSPQFEFRDFFSGVDHPRAGKLKYPTAPYRFSENPHYLNSPAPLLGQHNRDVYCDRLGYDSQDLIVWASNGVI